MCYIQKLSEVSNINIIVLRGRSLEFHFVFNERIKILSCSIQVIKYVF